MTEYRHPPGPDSRPPKRPRFRLASGLALAGLALILAGILIASGPAVADGDVPARWQREFPRTDFSRHVVPLDSFRDGGPPRDGIPPIDDPRFVPVGEVSDLGDRSPVISLSRGGVAKAYPLSILIWHEIVNDRIGGQPVAVTYCPLCNAAMAFDRRHEGRVLDFGTTGRLRKSDLVMYDRQTESWWQQFTGRGLVGEHAGDRLKVLPARLESFGEFAGRHPDGRVLVPSNRRLRAYGRTPYAGYDSARRPFLYRGQTPEGIAPLSRVVSLEDRARAWVRRRRWIRVASPGAAMWAP